MRYLYCLFLNRENPKEGLKTILQAIEYVKKGISICIFPEGTRNKGEELSMLPFKDGALKISTKTGCPIVPISMNNTAAIYIHTNLIGPSKEEKIVEAKTFPYVAVKMQFIDKNVVFE